MTQGLSTWKWNKEENWPANHELMANCQW
jgi:hypothetical protein